MIKIKYATQISCDDLNNALRWEMGQKRTSEFEGKWCPRARGRVVRAITAMARLIYACLPLHLSGIYDFRYCFYSVKHELVSVRICQCCRRHQVRRRFSRPHSFVIILHGVLSETASINLTLRSNTTGTYNYTFAMG